VLDLLLERKYVTPPEGFVCMELIPHNINIDFVGKRFFFVVFSLIINLVSIVLMLTWGLNYGLDFVGGAMIEVRLHKRRLQRRFKRRSQVRISMISPFKTWGVTAKFLCCGLNSGQNKI